MMWIASILPILALGVADGPAPLAAPAPPAPIFWRQKLFSIPFQVSRTDNPAQQPSQVQLWVSPDRGRNWGSPDRSGKWEDRPWLTAPPQKGYFLFQAGIDGEYWFDVRTVDRSGQVRPAGPHNPKLVVVVDTTPPKVELAAQRGNDGQITASFRIEELYLKSDNLAIDYRLGPSQPWQAVALAPGSMRSSNSIHSGEARWQPPYAAGTMEIRLRVTDLAGNPAERRAQVNLSTPPATSMGPAFSSGGNNSLNAPYPGSIPIGAGTYRAPGTASPAPSMSVPPGITAPSSSGTAAAGNWSAQNPPARMPWPGESASSGITSTMLAAGHNYGGNGDPANTVPGGAVAIRVPPAATNQLVTVRDSAATATAAASSAPPFSDFRASPPSGISPANTTSPFNGFGTGATGGPVNTALAGNVGPPPGEKLRWINSRVFQLTYGTRALGSAGNVPVQLWGTRDGGRTWESYGTDPLGQSPMLVTVPEEGIYGFQMLLQTGGSVAGRPPLPGDKPRTWIGIDLTKPVGRITQARQGIGRDGDKMLIVWEAADNRALADKPIAISYSETAGGPWILIASELPNTGQYTWQLKSSLPQHVYLRLEIRDAAGNIGIFETPEPTALDLSSPTVPVRDVNPLGWNSFRPGQQTYMR